MTLVDGIELLLRGRLYTMKHSRRMVFRPKRSALLGPFELTINDCNKLVRLEITHQGKVVFDCRAYNDRRVLCPDACHDALRQLRLDQVLISMSEIVSAVEEV